MDDRWIRLGDHYRYPPKIMTCSLEMRNGADNDEVVSADQIFSDCIAEGAQFSASKLTRVKFIRCDMYWASFFLASLTDVTFEEYDLRGSDFKETTLVRVQFINCDVGTDAIGSQTQFDGTDLSTVEFNNCRGL